jgi:hypothetical protein
VGPSGQFAERWHLWPIAAEPMHAGQPEPAARRRSIASPTLFDPSARCRCSEVDDPYLEYAPKQSCIKMVFQIFQAVIELANASTFGVVSSVSPFRRSETLETEQVGCQCVHNCWRFSRRNVRQTECGSQPRQSEAECLGPEPTEPEQFVDRHSRTGQGTRAVRIRNSRVVDGSQDLSNAICLLLV